MKIRPDKVASCPQIYCRCKCCRLFQKINIFVEKSLTNGPPFCILIVSNAERYRIDGQDKIRRDRSRQEWHKNTFFDGDVRHCLPGGFLISARLSLQGFFAATDAVRTRFAHKTTEKPL